MKYIMFVRDMGHGMKVAYPIIFPNMLVHADVAKFVHRGDLRDAILDSAGFIEQGIAKCYGRSESLNLDSKPKRDTDIIRMCDYGGQWIQSGD